MPQSFECGGDSAGYVLGALDGPELQVFERHLRTCTVCQEEIGSLQGVANVLGMAAPQYPVPKRLRRRVLDEVHADARDRQRAQRALRMPVRAAGRPLHRPGLVAAGAMCVLLLALVLASFTASPRTRVVQASVGAAQVMVAHNGHGELIVHRLTPLSTAWTYEVWVEHGRGGPQPTSDLFNVSPSGTGAVNLPSLAGVTEVMVTRERAGGTAVPTHTPVIVAKLD